MPSITANSLYRLIVTREDSIERLHLRVKQRTTLGAKRRQKRIANKLSTALVFVVIVFGKNLRNVKCF